MGDLPTFSWLFAVAGGFIILGIAIAYGLMQNRRRTLTERRVAEDGAHEIYKQDGRRGA